jgi:hypothetical protein
LQCCHCRCCHCCRIAAAAAKLPPPSCRRLAAVAATTKLLLPPHHRQAAATVTTAVTHAEIKHYTYIGIDNEYTLASTVIGTIRYYRTEYNRQTVNCIISYNFFFLKKTFLLIPQNSYKNKFIFIK